MGWHKHSCVPYSDRRGWERRLSRLRWLWREGKKQKPPLWPRIAGNSVPLLWVGLEKDKNYCNWNPLGLHNKTLRNRSGEALSLGVGLERKKFALGYNSMIGCLLGFIRISTVCVVSLILTALEWEGRRKELGSRNGIWPLRLVSFKILIKRGPIFLVLLH